MDGPNVPTGDWFTFLVTSVFTLVAVFGAGYTSQGRDNAAKTLRDLIEAGIDGGDRMLARRNLRSKKKRLIWWFVLIAIGMVSFFTPVRHDAVTTFELFGYLEVPVRFLRDFIALCLIGWEISMMLDDRDDNKSREQLAKVIREEQTRVEQAKLSGGVIGGLRAEDANPDKPPPDPEAKSGL